jgi:hypothetical protein
MTKKSAQPTIATIVEPTTPAIEATASLPTIEETLRASAAILEETTTAPSVWDGVSLTEQRPPSIWDDISLTQQKLDDAEIEEQIALGSSAVKPMYKRRYRDRAKALGLKRKWQKRSNNDWMATQLAGEVLDKNSKIHVPSMAAILIANGVEEPSVLDEHEQFVPEESRWPSQSKGWEGRYRMSGGLALRTVVAEQGFLALPDGEQLEAPADWIAKILR